MNSLEIMLLEREANARAADTQGDSKALLFRAYDREIRGVITMCTKAHPNGVPLESLRRRLVLRLISDQFQDRLKNLSKPG